MKNTSWAATTAVLSLLCAFVPLCRAADKDPLIPVGALTAFPTVVQTGTKPTLTWGITYPSTVQDVVQIVTPGTLVAKQTLDMEVRIIGASVKATTTNSKGQVTSQTWVPTECQYSYNNGGYTRIFYNTQDKVQPNKVMLSTTIYAGQPVNFGGRYYWNGSWSSLYNSTNSSKNVVALINGSTPPTSTPLYQQPTIESFLRPYLDNEGKVKIGPMDVIYLMELTHSNNQDAGFDLQDLVILVTFKSKNNNGHGNNVDGVDSSNPGNSKTGLDTDPTVDDEK